MPISCYHLWLKKGGRYHNVCISLMASGKESRVGGRQSWKNNHRTLGQQHREAEEVWGVLGGFEGS